MSDAELKFRLSSSLALLNPNAFQFQRIDALESLITLLSERRIRIDAAAVRALIHGEPQFDVVALLAERCLRPHFECTPLSIAPNVYNELALAIDALTVSLKFASPSLWVAARIDVANLVDCIEMDAPQQQQLQQPQLSLTTACAHCLGAVALLQNALVPVDLFKRLATIATVRPNTALRSLVASLYVTFASDCDDAFFRSTLGVAAQGIASTISSADHPFVVRARALNLLPDDVALLRSPLKKQSGSRRALVKKKLPM